MNDIIEKDKIIIENMIYEISEKQVMLDSDLARLYNCKNGTKEINQAVKNNIEKFPERYTWRLTDQESSSFLVKSFDQKIETRGGRYKKPRVFTEQGVAMLATVLKSKIAAEISIRIMDAFVAMRHHISSNLLDPIYYNEERISRLETKYIEHDTEIKLLQESFNKMSEKVKNNHLFYDGQVYDAYSLMIDIFNLSKKSIIIIDNYIDKTLLDILSQKSLNKDILVITNKYNKIDLNKYKQEYHNVTIKIINKIHDRFIIIDNKILYHCGASFKDLGIKCFAINKVEDKGLLDSVLNYINK